MEDFVFVAGVVPLSDAESKYTFTQLVDLLAERLTGKAGHFRCDDDFSCGPHPRRAGYWIVAGNVLATGTAN